MQGLREPPLAAPAEEEQLPPALEQLVSVPPEQGPPEPVAQPPGSAPEAEQPAGRAARGLKPRCPMRERGPPPSPRGPPRQQGPLDRDLPDLEGKRHPRTGSRNPQPPPLMPGRLPQGAKASPPERSGSPSVRARRKSAREEVSVSGRAVSGLASEDSFFKTVTIASRMTM